MAPKRKRPTPSHESPPTDVSSGEESRTGPLPPTAEEQREADEESGEEESGSSGAPSGSQSRSDDEAAYEQEPARPSQQKKKKPSLDSDSGSSYESDPRNVTRAVEPVAAAKEGASKKPARHQQSERQPAKRDGNAEGGGEESSGPSESHDEAARHEFLKPSRAKKPTPDLESSESKSEDETPAVKAVAAGKEVTPVEEPARSQELKKRPTERRRKGSDANNGARAGATTQHAGEGSPWFRRIWSENDEIKLLKGMIKFHKKKKLEPLTNFSLFKRFLDKKSVRFDFSPNESQIFNKIRSMKRKFSNGCKAGRIWKKPHDQKFFELSRVLWGGENGGEKVHSSLKKIKTSKNASKIVAPPTKLEEEEEFEDGIRASEPSLLRLTSMGLGEEVVKIGIGMIDSSEMEELKERWRQMRLSELQVASDRATLMNHQAKLFMDGYRRAKQQLQEADCDP